VKNDDRDYILVEDVAMDGPVKLVLESSPVKDPNPLPLRCSPSEVPCCGGHAHLSLSLSLDSSPFSLTACSLTSRLDLSN
jgi:hypothetical protein